jgi:acyl-CoA thioester hydrolase
MAEKVLKTQVEHTVNFNEVDMMGVVWHGHYFRFFEMAREAFARAHGIDVDELIEATLGAPIVKAGMKFKAPARYGDALVIEARHRIRKEPKFVIDYRVMHRNSGRLLAVGQTTQIFTGPDGEVFYFPPPLLEKFWKTWGGEGA